MSPAHAILRTWLTVNYRYLQSATIQAPLANLSSVIPDANPEGGMYSVDTAELFSALEGSTGSNNRGLLRVCQFLRIKQQEPKLDLDNLHNAGNDAHVCLYSGLHAPC